MLSRAAQKPWGQAASPATRSPPTRQGGPPGRDRARSKGPGVQARALSRTLPAARCREAGGAHSPLPTSGTRLRELPLLRVRASELPPAQPRPSQRSRARLQPADGRKGQGAPRVPGSDGRPQRHGRGAASPALALAAEQHGALRLVVRDPDAWRRSPRIGRAAVRVGSKQNPPPGSPPRGGAEVGGGLPGARTGPLTSAVALPTRGRPSALPAAGPLPPPGAAARPEA